MLDIQVRLGKVNNMNNKIKLLLNPTLFLECLIFCPLIVAMGFFIHYALSLAENYDLFAKIMCIIIDVFCIFYYFYALSISGAHIVISEKGVEFHHGFKKPVFHPWDYYGYCEKGYYLYYGAFPSYYIVLSTYKLKTCELTKINSIPVSEKVIRLKYNKKSFEALSKILPPRLSLSLVNQFKDIKATKVNFIP